MKIIVEYNNKTYEFNDGYYAYIFDYAICNEFDKKYGEDKLLEFINRVKIAYLKDGNATPLGSLTDFMAQNWKKIKDLGTWDILDKFYEQLP